VKVNGGMFLGSLLFAFVLLFFHFGLWPTLIFEQLSTDLIVIQTCMFGSAQRSGRSLQSPSL
jgi:hypothetical protein